MTQVLEKISRHNRLSLLAKRVLDIAGALLGLIMLSPLFLGVALAIGLDSPGPVFFRQTRLGKHGAPFQIYKFRTMAAGNGGPALTANADPRITRVGAFLRRTKLDELPQLINVLKGEMSLVGPRPETPDLIRYYTPAQRAMMLSVRPGMTDYASILFRDESRFFRGCDDHIEVYRLSIIPAKCAYYERYIRDLGFCADLRIIAATVAILAFKRVPKALNIET